MASTECRSSFSVYYGQIVTFKWMDKNHHTMITSASDRTLKIGEYLSTGMRCITFCDFIYPHGFVVNIRIVVSFLRTHVKRCALYGILSHGTAAQPAATDDCMAAFDIGRI